jgi:hypothetical protein
VGTLATSSWQRAGDISLAHSERLVQHPPVVKSETYTAFTNTPGGQQQALELTVNPVQLPSAISSQTDRDTSRSLDERRANEAPSIKTQADRSTHTGSVTSNTMYPAYGGQLGQKINISDTLIAPTHFYGLSSESPEDFSEHFQRYSDFKQLQKPQAAQLFGMLIRGCAGR